MIKIKNLHKSYGDLKVLNGLDLNVNKGDVYGFVGSNGSGKTTTMNIITKLITYDNGEIIINNNQPYKLGYLPETPTLYPFLTGAEYLNYIAKCCNYQGDYKKRTEEVLKIVKLLKASNRKIGGYSRGMVQRLGIASAIYDNPDLLILDEPTSALDPKGRFEVINIINALKEGGRTIILSSHILDDVERVATKIGILNNGKIVLEDKTENILQRSKNKKSHLVVVNEVSQDKVDKLTSLGLEVRVKHNRLEIDLPDSMSGNDLLKILLKEDVEIIKFEENNYNLERVYIEVTENESDQRND